MRFLGRLLVVLVASPRARRGVLPFAARGDGDARHRHRRAARAVFPQLNSLQKFAEWSPWRGIDPA